MASKVVAAVYILLCVYVYIAMCVYIYTHIVMCIYTYIHIVIYTLSYAYHMASKVVAAYDDNNDGHINFEEYCKMVGVTA